MKTHFTAIFFVLLGLLLSSPLTRGAETPLWNTASPTGQWRAFGTGMLQARPVGAGLAMDVDWTATTFGVGAAFGDNPEQPALPSLEGMHTLTVEAKANGVDGTVLAPEWVIPNGKDLRVATSHQAALTEEWQTFSFQLPDDFPGLNGHEELVKALRLLFLNPDKSGRGQVFFRDARLEP